MQIVSAWRAVPPALRGATVALGNFDGVHRGHVSLLRAAHAARPETALAVLSFEPHPRELFRPDDPPFRLTLAPHRAALLAAHQVQTLFQLPFDTAFAALTATQFMDDVLATGLGARHLCCGPDFAFGHRRGGSVALLSAWAERTGIGLTVVPPLCDTSGRITSSRIRRLLQDGYPETAATALGRIWSLQGTVAHGAARGRTIGFPTANIPLGRQLEPARGVYAVTLTPLDGSLGPPLGPMPGVANLGLRPTIADGQESRLEVHLFDWSGDLYGRAVDVALHSFLRPEQRFDSLDDLRRQIAVDAAAARASLAASLASSLAASLAASRAASLAASLAASG